ncbi:MAG TPA: Mrp/NBP35 family ATP-binding protein [Pirellulales bacterium]|jgi:ATP-binding protein involved in chromosome partitioning|nr:Mrp/NBP35 family ATP-binding protein [Pirellulales bacterium]
MSDLPDESAVREAIADFPDPETGRPLAETGQLGPLRVQADKIGVAIRLSSHSAVLKDEVRDEIIGRLRQRFPGVKGIEIEFLPFERRPEKIGQIGLAAKSVIAVGSGKGGVGKSTIAASLAFGLSRAGSSVGLMDADVYGPSIPHLLGVSRRPEVVEGRIQPVEAGGLKVMSMGFLVPPGEAVVWRGPMLHGAITQFLRDTAWGELDFLIIDMPPGTGDIALTLSQLLPLSGAVVVCTPQDVALLDAVKAVAMFRKVNIPLLGMVENMSGFVCPDCGKRYDIFGSGGARQRAAELGIAFLGDVPIQIGIRVAGDEGRTAGNFDDPQAAPYLSAICKNLVRNLARAREEAGVLPTLEGTP